MKKKILIGILLSYTQLSAINLEICAREPAICHDIQGNINNLQNFNKKSRLKSIVQLSRMVGALPSSKDNKKVQKILNSKVKQYDSIFGGKFFELLAKKNCDGGIYFVEAKFDRFYNVQFEERESSQIIIANNIIKLDNEEHTIPQSSIGKYKKSLDGIYLIPRVKEQSAQSTTSVENDNQICLTSQINLRNANKPYNKIAFVDELFFIENIGSKKKIKIWNPQKGKNITISAILVNAQSPDGQVNLTGYITASARYQRPCN